MRFAPDLEASRTRERARARLVDLSAPGGMVSSNRWWIDGGRVDLLRAARGRALGASSGAGPWSIGLLGEMEAYYLNSKIMLWSTSMSEIVKNEMLLRHNSALLLNWCVVRNLRELS